MGLADAAAVAALVRMAFAAQPVALEPPPSALGVTEAVVAEHLASGGGALAEHEDRVVGAVMWRVQDAGLYLGRLAVDPAYRRQGLGRALLAAGEAEARRRGLAYMRLGTRLALAGNQRLFADCGFVEVARHTHAGFAAPTWVEVEKQLAS
jgi:ribosomal protein S18 acetylase RimI-like enzyme